MKKALGYARFSSENQTENSIEAQEDAIKLYCKNNNIFLEHIYVDRAETGTEMERDAFQAMLRDIKENNYDYVVFHKSDRLARNRIESALTKRDIRSRGTEVLFVVGGNYDIETPEGMMMESLAETMDEYYSMNLSRETKKGLNNVAKKGLHTGGKTPYGYSADKETKQYVIVEHEAEAVRMIFNLFLMNYGYQRIAEELNDMGYQTASGRKFSKTSIYEILKNEKYIGTMVFNKYSKKRTSRQVRDDVIKIENAFEPIVSKDIYLRAQSKLNARLKPRLTNGRVYFLTGKTKCECGSPFVGNQYGTGKYKYHWYACTSKKNGRGCTVKDIKSDELEKMAIDILLEGVLNQESLNQLAEEAKEFYEKKEKTGSRELNSLRSKKTHLENQMIKLLDLYLEEKLSKDMYSSKTASFEGELSVINNRINELTSSTPAINVQKEIMSYISEYTVEQVMENKKLATALVDEFIDNILITPESIRFTYKVGDPYPFLTLAYKFSRKGNNLLSFEKTFL